MSNKINFVRNTVQKLKRAVSKTLDREFLASVYLKGKGIEIGALCSPLKVPSRAKVSYVDRMKVQDLRRQYPEMSSYSMVDVDILDNGETLGTIGDNTQDFVIANHFLEHCENPIKTIINLVRVLRYGGILYCCLPDKRYTFDNKREVTSFEHLLRDYTEGPPVSKVEHVHDWVVNAEKLTQEGEIQKRINEILSINYSIHFHVWTQNEMLDFLTQLREQFSLPIEIQLFMKHEAEVIFIIKKQHPESSVDIDKEKHSRLDTTFEQACQKD